jgi:hypothetical protein
VRQDQRALPRQTTKPRLPRIHLPLRHAGNRRP